MITNATKPTKTPDANRDSMDHILVVLTDTTHLESWVNLAAQLARGPAMIHLCALVDVPTGISPSEYALQARQKRDALDVLARARVDVHDTTSVMVDYQPMARALGDVMPSLDGTVDLLLVQWAGPADATGGMTTRELFNAVACDVVLLTREHWEHGPVLLSLRGGPNLTLSVRVAKALAGASPITLFNASPAGRALPNLQHLLREEPQITRAVTAIGDPAEGILREARFHSALVMGAGPTQPPTLAPPSAATGSTPEAKPLTQRILEQTEFPLVLVRTRTPEQIAFHAPLFIPRAKEDWSTRVDRWFAQNTYHNHEFEDVGALLAMKAKQGLTISLGLPALNEAETIDKVIATLKQALMIDAPLLDEIVLIDSNSTDDTPKIAEKHGVPVFQHPDILPEMGTFRGKGEALWKSLHALKGDIIVWVDTDIVNIHPRFVYGLIGPLLKTPQVQYVKGYYQRPIKIGGELQAFGGGRVTELVARPLLNLFYPELSGVIQPLSGEYAGRRTALEQVPFFSGYGVETGMLIDLHEKFGLDAIAQTDLDVRIHRNQELSSLSRMAFAIMQVFIARMEGRFDTQLLDKANRTMKMIVQEPERLALQLTDIADNERPPMIMVDAYRQARGIN